VATGLADGTGEAHAYMIRIEAGGIIDRHEAGFGQLWIVVDGRGWVAGGDGRRADVRTGDVAFVERGEQHAKGSDHGMTAVMVQVYDLEPLPGPGTD
jgi:quercetin dioxygenase-like cupin family protein